MCIRDRDYIVALDEEEISSKSQLVDAMKKIDKEEVVLKVRRSEDLIDIKLKPVRCSSKDYKLGIWVRDNAQGLGTITFLNADSQFGALGHGIHDVDTNTPVSYTHLDVYKRQGLSYPNSADKTLQM